VTDDAGAESGSPETFSVLFVCTGNICRSPMAEYLTRTSLQVRLGVGADRIAVASAGTWGHQGAPMERAALAILAEFGIAGENFRARELDAAMVAGADVVLTATREHRGAAVVLDPRSSARIFTLREFDRLTMGIDPAELPADLVERGQALVALAAGRRGLVPRVAAGADDVADPYGAPVESFRECAAEIVTALRGPVGLLAPPR
jgi:protein-tyrosine phosphatase